MKTKLETILLAGIRQLEIDISQEIQQKMLQYLLLLNKWNSVYNLTAIRNPEQMVTHHLLDSLAVLPYMWPEKWLDVGCGAGLPGLVLAMARPGWQFTLIDSNSKKTSFVQQAIIELKISNAEVYCARAEVWNPGPRFDGIISRAFAEISDFVGVSRHLLAQDGGWLAMKGNLHKEDSRLPDDIKLIKKITLDVPGVNAMRSVAILKMDRT